MSFVVDDVMAKAAVDGERIVAVARLLFAAVILVAWPMATWKGLRTGEHANIAVLALAALAAGVSVGSLLLDRRAWVTRRISMITVLIDALASLMMLAAFVTWPPVDYLGFGRLTGVGTAYLAILGAGVRLSRRGVLLSFGVLAPGLITLMVIDERQNGIVDTLANRLTIFAFLFTASVFAWLIAQRTRTLVLQGAQRAVDEMTARVALGAEVRVLRGHLGSHVIERSTTIAQALDSLAKRSDAPVSLEGTLLDGRFEIGRRLGAGGMGAVYEGKDRLSRGRRAGREAPALAAPGFPSTSAARLLTRCEETGWWCSARPTPPFRQRSFPTDLSASAGAGQRDSVEARHVLRADTPTFGRTLRP